MYARNSTNPPDEIEAAFPPLADDPSRPAASSLIASTFPYRARETRAIGPMIVMRPGPGQQQSEDPTLAAIESVQSEIRALSRTMRLLSAPWLTMPPDGESYHLASQGVVLPALAATAVVLQIICPPGRNGVLNEIANVFIGGGFTDFSGDVIWQILRNPANGVATAERNYDSITASLGSASNPGKIAPIRIFENDVIQLVVKNVVVPVALQKIGGLFGGWFYPKTWDDQFDRQGESVSW